MRNVLSIVLKTLSIDCSCSYLKRAKKCLCCQRCCWWWRTLLSAALAAALAAAAASAAVGGYCGLPSVSSSLQCAREGRIFYLAVPRLAHPHERLLFFHSNGFCSRLFFDSWKTIGSSNYFNGAVFTATLVLGASVRRPSQLYCHAVSPCCGCGGSFVLLVFQYFLKWKYYRFSHCLSCLQWLCLWVIVPSAAQMFVCKITMKNIDNSMFLLVQILALIDFLAPLDAAVCFPFALFGD